MCFELTKSSRLYFFGFGLNNSFSSQYRGRLAPTPSGFLHVGHAMTFYMAQLRAAAAGGALVMRVEDLDHARCKETFIHAMMRDLSWFGLSWTEGADLGGDFGPYRQSERLSHYQKVWKQLGQSGFIYPSPHSRKDVRNALSAPHEGEGEAIFPPSLRPSENVVIKALESRDINWRFRVPDGKAISFVDERCGMTTYTAGIDFGDFLIWRKDGLPSYELAVVIDDHDMQITEVVRGEDLLLSTARQLLLYSALDWTPPAFYHCPLVRDERGQRLAKRHAGMSLCDLREAGKKPKEILEEFLA